MKTYFIKNRSIILLTLFFAALRFVVSFQFELGTDEAHYVLYGKHLSLSYFDHPPLVGWVHYIFLIFQSISAEAAARIPAILSSLFGSLLINEWLRRKNYSEQSRWFGIFGLNIAILFSALSFFFLPDTILFILVPLLSLVVENLMRKKTLLNWVIFGAVLGLSGLTKYTAVLFLVPIAWYWIKTKSLKDFLTPSFWLAVVIAFIIVSPVLIWNLQNDFISFKYQTGHVISFKTMNFATFFGAQASQLLGLSFLYFYCFHKPKNDQDRFDFLLVLTPLVFFSFFALFENFLPHWTAPFFILAVPWGVAENIRRHNGLTKKLKTALIAGAVLFTFVHLELAFHMLPFKMGRDLHRDIQGWHEFTKRSLQKSAYPLGVTNWTFGSRVKLYSEIEGRENVIVLDDRIDQFDIWSAKLPPAPNILMLVERKTETEFLNTVSCDQQKDLGIDGPKYKDQFLIEFKLIECVGFKRK